jgi:hypothetical protein
MRTRAQREKHDIRQANRVNSMPTNFVLLQGRFEITNVQDVEVKRGRHSETVRQVDGFVHVAASALGGQHRVRLVNTAAAVAEEWMRQRPTDGFPEVVIEGRLFTPSDGKAYVLVEFIRFVGTRNLSLRNGNFPAHRHPGR